MPFEKGGEQLAGPPPSRGPATGMNSRKRQEMISEVSPSTFSCGTA